MATNPMQKKARNAFLLGVVIMLIIVLMVAAILYLTVFRDKLGDKKEEGVLTAYVYKLVQDVKAGEEITFDMVMEVETTNQVTPIDSFEAKTQGADGKLQSVGFVSGYKAKIDLKSETILSYSMVYEGEPMADDIRLVEFNMITLPMTLSVGDSIDVRITMPSGQDFIVVTKKEIVSVSGQTIGIQLSEDEILMMNCAIVENYKITASHMYAVQYVDPGMQAEATPTYPLNGEVLELINRDPNIVAEAKNAIATRQNTDLGDLNSLRQRFINIELEKYTDQALTNVESLMREQQTKAKDAREKYLSELEGY